MLGVTGAGLVAADLAGRILAWNPAATRLFGWTASEVAGERYDEIIGADLHPTDTALITACGMLAQCWSGRVRARDRDARPLLLRGDQLPLPDPAGPVVATGTVSPRLPPPAREPSGACGSDR